MKTVENIKRKEIIHELRLRDREHDIFNAMVMIRGVMDQWLLVCTIS